MIAEKLPENEAHERRRKAKKTAQKKGRQPTEKHLFLLGWNLYVTNIEPEVLEGKAVRIFYSLLQVKASKVLLLITDSLSFCDFLFTEFQEACRLCSMESRKRLSTAQKIRMISDALP